MTGYYNDPTYGQEIQQVNEEEIREVRDYDCYSESENQNEE